MRPVVRGCGGGVAAFFPWCADEVAGAGAHVPPSEPPTLLPSRVLAQFERPDRRFCLSSSLRFSMASLSSRVLGQFERPDRRLGRMGRTISSFPPPPAAALLAPSSHSPPPSAPPGHVWAILLSPSTCLSSLLIVLDERSSVLHTGHSRRDRGISPAASRSSLRARNHRSTQGRQSACPSSADPSLMHARR